MSASTIRLRAEYQHDALGIGSAAPRLTWINTGTSDGWGQDAYELSCTGVAGTAQVRVESGDSVFVAWPFPSLRSRERVEVRVRALGSGGEWTDWSEALVVEAGLLEPSDWNALPICAHIKGEVPERPLRFRREFDVRAGLVAARLYSSALGICAWECNGTATSDELLAPGWTSYTHRIRYRTTDLTAQLSEGPNALGVTVAEGWYRGRFGFEGGQREIFGSEIGPIAQLELVYADGSRDTVVTDGSWRASTGPILFAGLYEGAHLDSRLGTPGWSTAGFDDSSWSDVTVLDSIADRLEAPFGPPVRAMETIAPLSITASPSGKTLVDFGQNISGFVRVRVQGPSGTEVTLRHAEVLEHGELGTRPLRLAAATDIFVLSGTGAIETFEPAFTIHGFRYVQVDGWPGDLRGEDLEAVVCHSDMEPTGTFECSHSGLNQLYSNVRWSMRDNFVDLPTDCPQRDERLGWTGDIQVFTPAATDLYDCNGFLASWLIDVAHEQEQYGQVPPYVPYISLHFPLMPFAVWSDAATIVPWVLHERYADTGVLRRQYPSMCRLVDSVVTRLDPDGIWRQDMQLGDWLDPTAPPDKPAQARTDGIIVAQAYHVASARLLSKMAGILGESADEARYAEIAKRAYEAFNREFVTPSGRLASDAPTAYALAICFDLLTSPEQRERAGRRLVELVTADGHRISTGFVGTPLICDALVEIGAVDDALWLLQQTDCPSWLYSVSMGATTIWERWDSMLPDGSINPGDMTSFNHYALGAVADFMVRRLAGLAPAAPGYRELRVAPRPAGGLSHAKASLRTPYGLTRVSWTRTGTTMSLDLTVPSSTTAVVDLPSGEPVTVGSGTHHFECECVDPATERTRAPKRNFMGHILPDD